MTFRELSKKEVVQLEEGACLGRIDDLVIDPETARVEKLLMLGRPKLFGLLGRGETLVIDWGEIEKIGTDALLVSTKLPETGGPGAGGQKPEGKKPGLLHRLLGG